MAIVFQMDTPVAAMQTAALCRSPRLPSNLRVTDVSSGGIPFLSGSEGGQDCSRCSFVWILRMTIVELAVNVVV